MTTHPAASEPSHLPPMRTIGELRAALVMGYGFPGDADDFEAELAREINHADPADLSGVEAAEEAVTLPRPASEADSLMPMMSVARPDFEAVRLLEPAWRSTRITSVQPISRRLSTGVPPVQHRRAAPQTLHGFPGPSEWRRRDKDTCR
ncbi:hypothetical protein [Streptomyces sp. PSKA30]|uniref:hypothetical protein n=1 Tax=Streptomyces sp. PSKA30 TaxID=2874597 RepID=UPI001CD137F8|nr:hypothetical protein [Streptomyces sp. PSKA30]MBZ9645914.1 hypothetical protein [Streptomyces sp. PSKA30]